MLPPIKQTLYQKRATTLKGRNGDGLELCQHPSWENRFFTKLEPVFFEIASRRQLAY